MSFKAIGIRLLETPNKIKATLHFNWNRVKTNHRSIKKTIKLTTIIVFETELLLLIKCLSKIITNVMYMYNSAH